MVYSDSIDEYIVDVQDWNPSGWRERLVNNLRRDDSDNTHSDDSGSDPESVWNLDERMEMVGLDEG